MVLLFLKGYFPFTECLYSAPKLCCLYIVAELFSCQLRAVRAYFLSDHCIYCPPYPHSYFERTYLGGLVALLRLLAFGCLFSFSRHLSRVTGQVLTLRNLFVPLFSCLSCTLWPSFSTPCRFYLHSRSVYLGTFYYGAVSVLLCLGYTLYLVESFSTLRSPFLFPVYQITMR